MATSPVAAAPTARKAELAKIASRGAKHGLDYGTDEDLFTADPNINQWDLGADPLKFAQDRMALAEELMKGLADRVVDKGEGYQRARVAFSLMLQQYGNCRVPGGSVRRRRACVTAITRGMPRLAIRSCP